MEKPKFRIGFDINGVLRNTIGKIEQTYEKFYLSKTDGIEYKVKLYYSAEKLSEVKFFLAQLLKQKKETKNI